MSSADIVQDRITFNNGAAAEHWPARFRPALSLLADELRRHSNGETISIDPIRELPRPFSSVLKVRIAHGSQYRGAFVKLLKPRSDTPAELAGTGRTVEREFDMTCRVADAVKGVAGLGAANPIACFPEHLALVTEEVQGVTLSRLLARRAAGWPGARAVERLANTVRLTSQWLLATQRGIRPDREVNADTITKYLDRRINELSTAPKGMLTASGRDSLRRSRDLLLEAASRDDLSAVWIHADFCAENIVVNDAAVTVLDLTMAGAGTRYHDLAHLFVGLESMRGLPWFAATTVDRLQTSLLEGFEPGLDVERPLFKLARFQHVLCHLVAFQDIEGRLVRLLTGLQRRRDRAWLSRVAGLGKESWAK